MGPNTNDENLMRALVKNGMDIARFNFSPIPFSYFYFQNFRTNALLFPRYYFTCIWEKR